MKKRIVTGIFAIVFLLSATCAQAADLQEARASRYFDGYLLGLSAQGNQTMVLSYAVYGTGTMDKIGAYSIRIEEAIATDTWIESFTAYGDDDPSNFYTRNAYDHYGSITFTGIPGVKYRAVLVAYAKNSSGSEYSREITCTAKYCK